MIVIRSAHPDEAAGIAGVHEASWKESYRGLLDGAYLDRLEKERLTPRWREHLMRRIQDHDEEIIVAVVGEEVIGFASVGACREPNSAWAGEVSMLYVLKEHRGLGVGRALMKAAADHLIRRAIFSCCVWVLRDNGAARDFYEALEGEPGGRKLDSVGGQIVPLVAYVWPDVAKLAERRSPTISLWRV